MTALVSARTGRSARWALLSRLNWSRPRRRWYVVEGYDVFQIGSGGFWVATTGQIDTLIIHTTAPTFTGVLEWILNEKEKP